MKKINIGQFSELLAVKYWPAWLMIMLMRSIARLPFFLQLKIGGLLGLAAKKLLVRLRHGCEVNLQLCFPLLEMQQHKNLVKKYFISLGISCVELCFSLFMSHRRFQKLISVDGLEHIQKAQAENKSIIIITAHFTTLPVIVRFLTQTLPLAIVLRPQKNLLINRLLIKRSEQALQKITYIHRDNVREIMRCLKNNEALLYLPDQDLGARHSLFVPFFNIPAASTHALSQLAQFKSSVVIPLFCHRKENNQGYALRFASPLDNFPSENDYQDMQHINQILENAIKEHPEQYMWSYNRFRTRPLGEPDVYKYEHRKIYR
jgi:KDO2-lipid IV(A) lauroyltransferase